MDTFERGGVGCGGAEGQQYCQYPLRRLEPAVQKFLKVIQIDLSRLQRHKLNVERFNRLQDWQSLHSEQINATRTVQQIKANLHEIEKSRLQVQEEDVTKFDEKIGPVKQLAMTAVVEFLDLTGKPNRGESSSDASPEEDQRPLTLKGEGHPLQGQSLIESQLQLHDLPENTAVAESWDHLQENLQDLNDMIHQYASLVSDQQEGVDRIEENIESAHTDVNQGVQQLGKAAKYKAAMYPLAGALIGTVVGGPVGLVAGLKLGGLVGVVGGTAGFFSGKFIKKRKDQITDIELTKLSRSNSLPDVSDTKPYENNRSFFSLQRFRYSSESSASGLSHSSPLSEADSWEKVDSSDLK